MAARPLDFKKYKLTFAAFKSVSKVKLHIGNKNIFLDLHRVNLYFQIKQYFGPCIGPKVKPDSNFIV